MENKKEMVKVSVVESEEKFVEVFLRDVLLDAELEVLECCPLDFDWKLTSGFYAHCKEGEGNEIDVMMREVPNPASWEELEKRAICYEAELIKIFNADKPIDSFERIVIITTNYKAIGMERKERSTSNTVKCTVQKDGTSWSIKSRYYYIDKSEGEFPLSCGGKVRYIIYR